MDPISRLKDGQVLDVGPVCEENIMFFASRLRKLYVCDMFLRLIREKSVPRHSRNVWRHLDYPERFFDGIHLTVSRRHDTAVKGDGVCLLLPAVLQSIQLPAELFDAPAVVRDM